MKIKIKLLSRAETVLSTLLALSLGLLYLLVQPRRLDSVTLELPLVEEYVRARDVHESQRPVVKHSAKFKSPLVLGAEYPLPEYTAFLNDAPDAKTLEEFDTFVSLKKRAVFEVKVASERYPMTYNPTIIALPPTSHYPFLIVSRVRGDSFEQHSLICEAKYGEQLNGDGNLEPVLQCATHARELVVPQTPAKDCKGKEFMSDVPGYHDPRVFWSARGAPMMIFNQQSRYGCFGLWMIDLRTVYPTLRYRVNRALLNQYSTVTELTRHEGRRYVEKNYLVFYDAETDAEYVQFELGHNTRHFARLVGNGLTTRNLTLSLEQSCIHLDATWHQATNAIKVVLCKYGECEPGPENTVYISFLHRKEGIKGSLKVQYFRYLAMWRTVAPFQMVGFSSKPIRFDNEDEWEQKFDVEGKFLYTVSMAWETNQNRYEGYLNENVIVSLGVGDHGNAAVVVPAVELMGGMHKCT
ncbi:hypothetical protein V1514DRAFT_321558 [Lipomyces japonicus]|uniref:uncharacterized protein n=1 Tax=Lipomyces japonicus TaxID=56871 RepID=UPI0034CDC129